MTDRLAVVPDALAGERLDRALARLLDISRGEARRALAAGRVLLDRKRCKVAGRKVSAGASVALLPAPLTWTAPEPRIVHLDHDMVVVDKPPGVAVQAGKNPRLPDLTRWWRETRTEDLKVVHRLDVPASGLVVLARRRSAAARLSKAFADRLACRQYRARLSAPLTDQTIELPLTKEHGMALVSDTGQPAITHVVALEDGDVELTLETGRFHQLRAHLAAVGAPILGDRRYGGATGDRLHLHACRLTIAGQTFESEAPWLHETGSTLLAPDPKS